MTRRSIPLYQNMPVGQVEFGSGAGYRTERSRRSAWAAGWIAVPTARWKDKT
jgi:hypothetical protein